MMHDVPEYESKSFEELRFEDYSDGLKFISQSKFLFNQKTDCLPLSLDRMCLTLFLFKLILF